MLFGAAGTCIPSAIRSQTCCSDIRSNSLWRTSTCQDFRAFSLSSLNGRP